MTWSLQLSAKPEHRIYVGGGKFARGGSKAG
jgi:hypothetical protein